MGCFRLTPLLTKVSHLFWMVVIVRKCVIDGCEVEIKLIGGIRRRVHIIKSEFRDISDVETRLRDLRLTVAGILGCYDCRR